MRSRRSFRLALGASFFLLSMLHAPIAGAAAPLQKIVFVFAGFNERSGFIFVAKDRRFFEEQGLDAQIVQVRSGQVAVSAMAANEAQFYAVSATGASLGAMAGGLDLVFIAGIVNKLDGDFVASPKIAAPSDLKGKLLGVQSIGGGIWTFTMLALDHWGLVPERDKIQFRILGDQAVIAQGLISGAVDAAYLGYSFSKVAQREGFRVLEDLAKPIFPTRGSASSPARVFWISLPMLPKRRSKPSASRSPIFRTRPTNRPSSASWRNGCVCRTSRTPRWATRPCGSYIRAASSRPWTACAIPCAFSAASTRSSAN